MRKLLLLVTVLVVFSAESFATTYYYSGSGNLNAASWWTTRTGGATAVTLNTGVNGDIFIIQGSTDANGNPTGVANQTATNSSTAAPVTGVTLEIEPGATLTTTSAITLIAGDIFKIDNNGTYNHNHSGAFSAILGGTEIFAVTSNFNVGASNPTTGPTSTALPGGFGNFTFTGAATMQCNDVFPNVAGNFTHNGTAEFRMSASTVVNGGFTVNGNFSMTPSASTGIFSFGNNVYGVAGTPLAPSVTVKGNFIFTAGTIQSAITNGSAGAGNSNAKFIFAKTGTQTFTKAAGVGTFTATVSGFRQISFNVQSGSTLDMGTSVIDGAATTNLAIVINSGAGLITANTNGIASGLTASGSFQNLGGSRTFNTGADYTYNGSSAQITGTGFTGANNLTINNASGVTLTSPASVTGTLTLTSGKLDIGANNLTVGTTSGASSSNYIVTSSTGSVVKSIASGGGSFTFPVGRSSSVYNPLTITNTGGTTLAYTVNTGATSYTNPAAGTNAQWNISTTGGSSTSTLAFGWSTSDAGATLAGTPANGTAWNYVGSSVWTNMNGSTTGTPNTTTVSGITDLSSPVWTVAVVIPATPPTVTTTAVTSVTSSSAATGGNVTSEGTSPVTERGVVYSTSANPTVANTKVIDGSGGAGSYTSSLSGLNPGTTYHVRAYAISTDGTSYGSDQFFTTSTTAPVVGSTTAASSITANTASTGGNVTSDGGIAITERGVVYSTVTGPTTADTKVTAAGTTGSFTSSLTNLTASTTYFVRAYAINSLGTSYGNEISFSTTAATVPVVTTTAATGVTATVATTGGNVTATGGAAITERGVVYSTSLNPTTADTKVTDGAATTGSYVSSLSGLSANTTYHVRAYAINSVGTGYGSDVTFTTFGPPVTYYSQSSGDVLTLSNWNTVPAGGGSSPTSFNNPGDTYIIQSGNSMTTSGAWSIAGSTGGSKLEIANGGTLTNTALITVQNFQVDNGGTYNHNYTSATVNGLSTDIPGSTGVGRVFGATSSVVINNWATAATTAPVALPTIASPGWGSLTINIPTLGGSINMVGALTAVQGNLTILATGGTTREFRLTATTAYTLTVGGDLTLTGGILNLGSSSSTSVIVWNVGGNLVFNGGTMATASTNTNVTINVTGALNFSAGSNGSTAGLTYNIHNGMNVSGGTFNLGTSSSHNTTIVVTGDINLTNAGQMSNVSSSNNIVSLTGNLNMSGTSLYQMQNSSASGHTLSLTIGGNFNMTSGTFTGGSGSQKATVTFSGGTSAVSFTAGGTITTAKPTDWIVAINKTVTLNNNLPVVTNTLVGTVTVNGTLDCGTNNVTGTGAFTLSSGGTLKMGSPLGISSVAASGNIQVTGARSYSQSGNYEYNGSSAQVTGNQLPATVNNLTINNATGVTLTNGVTVNGTLALSNGILNTGGNTPIIAATGNVSGASASSYVNGLLKRFIAAGSSSASFPIGDASSYTPVTTSFNGTISASTGSITASTTATDHPQITSSGLNDNLTVNRYWTLTNNTVIPGMTTYSPTLTFVAGDKDGGLNTNNLSVRVYDGANWHFTNTGSHTSLSTQATGVNVFGDLQIGEPFSLTVSTQPTTQSVCQGSDATFTAASTSTPATTVKWQRSTDGTAAYVDITSANMDAGTTYSGFNTGTLSLTAPSAAMDNYHYRAVFSNINGVVNSNAATLNVTVQPTATSISYSGSPYCANGGTATVTRNATAGGTYSSTAGLSIDANTGDITLGTSTPGTYTVTYFIAAAGGCSFASTSTSVTIVNPATLAISYPGTPFCKTGIAFVTRTGAAGGTYSSDAGMSVNPTTGYLYIGNSTVGSHIITYSVPFPAGCTSTASTTITILPLPTITLGTAATICANTATAVLPYTATTASPTTYSIRSDVNNPMPNYIPVVNSPLSGGTINVQVPANTPGGTYYFDLTVANANGCVSAGKYVFAVTVATPPTTTISYAGTPFCGTSVGFVTRTPAGGTFSSTPGLSLNATSGTIFPAPSTPGNYTVTYTVTLSGCTYTANTQVTILPTPGITLGSAPMLCFSAGAQTALLPYTATTNSPVSYSINADASSPMPNFTPVVDAPLTGSPISVAVPAGTPGGTYKFDLYVKSGSGCSSVRYTFTVSIVTNTTTIAYNGGQPVCQTGTALVTLSGTSGGTYSSDANLNINSTTGAIYPAASTLGTHTVTYTISTAGCSFATTTNVTIVPLPKVTIGTVAPVCISANAQTASVPYTVTASTPVSYSITVGATNPMPGYVAVTDAAISNPISVSIPAGTAAGTYSFYLTLKSAGGCVSSKYTFFVTVKPVPTASIAYTNSPYSTAVTGAAVTNSGTTGGTYSSTAGLSLNTTTGSIFPHQSTPGTYTVTYTVTTATNCTATTTTQVTIVSATTPRMVTTGVKGTTTAKATPVVSLSDNIVIAPNPVENMLNINAAGVDGTMQLRITNVAGREVVKNTRFSSSFKLDMSGYAAGLYVVELVNEKTGEVTRKKIVKL